MLKGEIILKKNDYGELSYCKNCNLYFLRFSNLLIELNERELKAFLLVVKNVDINYWNKINKSSSNLRIYPISTCQQNLVLLFNSSELEAIKDLVSLSRSEYPKPMRFINGRKNKFFLN